MSKEFRNLYRFNCISSGFIKSKMSDEILNYYTSEQKTEILKAIQDEYKLMKAAWDKAGKKSTPFKKKGFWDRINNE